MKKLSLLLASIGAGLLLVGGTVAAYIVTAASDKGVRVTPGTLQTDEVGHIALSWGGLSIHDVGDLTAGEEAEIGTFTLNAASDDVDAELLAAYQGTFKITLRNTTTVDPSDPNLLEYLVVNAYSGSGYSNLEVTVDGTANETEKAKSLVQGTSLKAKVMLDLSALSLEDDEYASLLEQTVYVEFAWGPGSQDSDSNKIGTLYYVDTQGWTTPCFFAQGNGYRNAKYPGVDMTYVYDTKINTNTYKVYSVEVDTAANKYDTFVFSDRANAENMHQVNGVDSTELGKIKDGTAPTIVYGSQNFSAKPTVELAAYYVRGEFGGAFHWGFSNDDLEADNAYALRVTETEGQAHFEINLVAGDKFKIYVPAAEKWVSPLGENYVIHEKGELENDGDPGTPGRYTICCATYQVDSNWGENNGYWYYIANLGLSA